MEFENFHIAFQKVLSLVYLSPEFIVSPRGFTNRERLNINFKINNPRERICYLPSRKTNIIFNFAEVLWYLSGSNSLEFIEHYCKGMRKYSKNGHTLTGCAYGPKIFAFGERKINQWDRIIKLLRDDDAASKRAVIQIFDPDEVLDSSNIDLTCTLGLQFFVRENKLYLSAFMRANDCFRGIVSDVFSFTFIQELLAAELDLEMGSYYHNVGTLHTFDYDDKNIQEVLNESGKEPALIPYKFPKMPRGDNWRHIRVLLELEEALRKEKILFSLDVLERTGLPEYWAQILLLFGIHQNILHERTIDPDLWDKLSLGYQYLVKNKWPLRCPSLTNNGSFYG